MLRSGATEMKMIAVWNSKKAITMFNDWNGYFFWEARAMETERYPYNIPHEIPQLHEYGYEYWVGNFESGSKLSEDAWCVITYTRTVTSPYLDELSRIQNECEKLIGELGIVDIDAKNAQEKLKSIFKKVRQENAAIIEQCEKKNKILRADIDLLLKRAEELRTLIQQGH